MTAQFWQGVWLGLAAGVAVVAVAASRACRRGGRMW